MKSKKMTAGFTLVELIVAIAILGILAGVGTVGYSGYIKKANMAADQQLVAGVRNALELQFYNDLGYEGVSAVILTTDGASAESDDSFAAAAMAAAYGDGWKSNKLNYSGWGNGASISQSVIDYFMNGDYDDALSAIYNGTATPSFANDVDSLFLLIKDTAAGVGTSLNQSGASLVQSAAEYTLTNDSELNANSFANYWATSTWDTSILGSANGEYNEDAGELTDTDTSKALSAAIANAAAIKARNTALATYLRDAGYDGVYDSISNYTYGSNSIVPKDFVGTLLNGTSDERSACYVLIAQNLGLEESVAMQKMPEVIEKINTYFSDGTAKTDGLAYYALMDTVNSVNTTNSDDDTYWDEMSAAVSLYGAIASGSANLDNLSEIYSTFGEIDGAVVVTAMASNGKITVNVSPSGALAGQ